MTHLSCDERPRHGGDHGPGLHQCLFKGPGHQNVELQSLGAEWLFCRRVRRSTVRHDRLPSRSGYGPSHRQTHAQALRAKLYYDPNATSLIKAAFTSKELLKGGTLQIYQRLPNGMVKITQEIQLGEGSINAYSAPTQGAGPHVVEFIVRVVSSKPMQRVQGLNDFKLAS